MKVGIELLGEASRLAAVLGQKVGAILIGSSVYEKAAVLHQYGADLVVVADNPMLKEYVTEPYAKALTAVIRKYEPEIVLFGATSIGRDLAPRVSCRIKTGLTADCTALHIDPETRLLHMTRPAFGGNIMAEILCKTHRPQMATVRPGVMKPLKRNASRTGVVEVLDIKFEKADMNIEIIKISKAEKAIADITDAKCLISGGRGIGGPEFFDKLRDLADAIGPGSEVSSSRAAVEAGWIDKGRQVGQTGKTVRPLLYMACGISGTIQHLVGMESSDFIIAINKDETAPIFGVADLGIVGDAQTVVPKLAQAIRKKKEQKYVD